MLCYLSTMTKIRTRILFGFFTLAVVVMSATSCVKAVPTVPDRPQTVPASSVWAGGVDGGAWIACTNVDEARINYRCTVHDDGVGELWAEGDYTLVRLR